MRFLTPLQDIQTEINFLATNGETTFQLGVGTYNLTTDLIIPRNVYLNGETRDGVIIDFGGGAYSIKVYGTNIYNTGTVDVVNGSTAVVGTSTVWDDSMNGRTIFLGNYYYTIDTVSDANNLTLIDAYAGDDLVTAPYSISDATNNIKIEDLTVQNSSVVGIDISNCIQSYLTNLNIYDCGTGIKELNCITVSPENLSMFGNNIDMDFTYAWSWTTYNTSFGGSISDSIVMVSSGNAVFYDNGIDSAGGRGMVLTDCQDMNIAFSTFSNNVSHGLEFVSGVSGVQVNGVAFNDNGGDAMKLTATSNRNTMGETTIVGNTGNAITISAATCNDNIILGNILYSNGGTVADSGTGTLIRSNIGVADN